MTEPQITRDMILENTVHEEIDLPEVARSDDTVERFDTSRIVDSLMKETGMDVMDAIMVTQKVVERLKNSKSSLLSGPHIRNICCSVMMELGMEKERIRYTSPGIPMHVLDEMLNNTSGYIDNANLMRNPETVAKIVNDYMMEQYTFLKMPRHLSRAHLSGDIYIKDRDSFYTRDYCASWDCRQFLKLGIAPDGLGGMHSSYAKPAKHIDTVMNHAAIWLASSQCNHSGGQGFHFFNTLIAPYVRGLSRKKINQACQQFVFTMTQNYVSRGGQSIGKYEHIYLYSDKSLIVRSIGNFIDEIIEKNPEMVVTTEDTEIIYLEEPVKTISVNKETGMSELKEIYAVSRHKPRGKVYKVTGKDNSSVVLTEDHGLINYDENGNLVERKPMEASHLLKTFHSPLTDKFDIGDMVHTGYERVNSPHNTRQNDIPKEIPISPDMCMFLGLFTAEGSYGINSIRVANKSDEIDGFVRKYMSDINEDITISRKDNSTDFTNMGMFDFIGGIINSGAQNKNIPDMILHGSREMKLAYLGGLVSGGGYISHNGRMNIYTTSRTLVGHLHLLLSSLNIQYSIAKIKKSRKELTIKGIKTIRNHDCYDIAIEKCSTKHIEPFILIDRKKNNIIESNYNQLPVNYRIIKDHLKNIVTNKPSQDYAWRSNNRRLKIRTLELIKSLNPELTDKIERFKRNLPIEIKSIEEIEYDDYVYDLSVRDNENFVTSNGIVCHNTVFSSIDLSPGIPSILQDVNAVGPSGKILSDTYSDYEDESRMIFDEFMNIFIEGDGRGKPFGFPKPNIILKKEFMNGEYDESWRLVAELTAKHGTPYFDNYLNWRSKVEAGCSSCCSHLWEATSDEDLQEFIDGSKVFGASQMVTPNFGRIAWIARNNESKFFELLDERLVLSKEVILEKNRALHGLIESGSVPFYTQPKINGDPLIDPDDKEYLIGTVGFDEMSKIMTGHHLHEREGTKFGIKVLKHVRERVEEFQKETGLRFGITRTPAESAAGRLAMKDYKKYPDIRPYLKGVYPNIYYTNSTALYVGADLSLSSRIKKEGMFHPYMTGGALTHIYLGESNPDPDALWSLTKKIARYTLNSYFAFTKDVLWCHSCNYQNGIDWRTSRIESLFDLDNIRCPKCKSHNCEIYSRITGYVQGVNSSWNQSKRQEFVDRHRYRL